MATMQQVADKANVSLSTVSYVMSGTRAVGKETKARVRKAMTELGYQPNFAARSLASRRSNVIALVFPAAEHGLGGTVAEFVDSAAQTAREFGFNLVLWPFKTSEADQIVNLARQGMADGVLVMEVALNDARVEALSQANVPFTMIGRTSELDGRPWVDVDFDQTIEQAVNYLYQLGHRNISFVNHSEQSAATGYAPTFRAADAFDKALKQRGLAPISVRCDETPTAGRAVVDRLFDSNPMLSAIITMNELATFGILAELSARGIQVPNDMSVLSVVSSPGVSQMSSPPLSTMNTPGAELGRLAVLKLLSEIGETVPSDTRLLIPCSLSEGGTVARAWQGH